MIYVEDLLVGIRAAFTANGTLSSALSGGLHRSQAPQDTSFPYGIIYINTDSARYTFTEEGEYYQVHFNVFDNTPLDDRPLLSLFDKMMGVYDWADLTVTDYNFIYMKRLSANYGEAEGVWQLSILYECEIQKDR